ncbi:MAG: Maf family protein [Pseudomonadota bacterium]
MPQSIVLASSSNYRAALLRQLLAPVGLEFLQFAPDIDESQVGNEPASAMAYRLSQAKAKAALDSYPDSIIIASDQVPFHPRAGHILRKPGSEANAIAQLRACSEACVEFYTGLCVISPGQTNNQIQTCVEQFNVIFRALSNAEIERYVAIEKPFDCAGAFKVEGLGISLFERLEGRDHNTLIGLPLIQLTDFLRNCGLQIP